MKLPCAIVRGGTSKGVFLLEDHLPADPVQRTRLLLALMGSPDPRQINGLGGADPLTSKVAIVSRSTREGIDVEYESVEVGIGEAAVTHGIMCGNLLAGVAAFAIAEGLILPQTPATTVNIYCRSNQKAVRARVPWQGNEGDHDAVELAFHQPGGAVTGKLLPTGEALTTLLVDSAALALTLPVSIVDAGTLYAFVRARDLGLSGDEEAAVLDRNDALRATIEALREAVAQHVNARRFQRVPLIGPRLVKIALVAPSARDEADIAARVINRAAVHKAFSVSGGICLAAAAAIPGTVVHDVARQAASPFTLRIGHPSGIMTLVLHWADEAAGVAIQAAEIRRDARILMRGTAYLPDGLPEGLPDGLAAASVSIAASSGERP